MELLEQYGNIWSIIETCGFLFVIFLFFKDPIRRWNFFGYRPTAVMGLYDPKIQKVLLIKKHGESWYAFSQGGIYNPNLNFTVREILSRELGLNPTRFGLRFTEPLGTIAIKDKELLKRATISTVSVVKSLRGKGYIGCYVRANFDNIEELIQKGEDLEEAKIVTIEEGKQLIRGAGESFLRHGRKKQQILLRMLDKINEEIALYQNKNSEAEEETHSHPDK